MTVRKLARMLFIVNGMQALIGAVILLGLQFQVFDQAEFILNLGMGLMLLSSLLTIAGLWSVTRYQDQSYRESMENLENFNSKLREQRHDYLNQIQIVYGLLELEEYEEAREYLRPVFKDMMKVNRAMRTALPAVNALLQAKMEAAEKQEIDFYLEVGTQLSELGMEPWEFCKILANLIDNAVTAVQNVSGEKTISLEIREKKEAYQIAVRNNGPKIPESHRKLIFHQGFTTKKGEGHGMGLSIVSSLLKEVKGSMEVESTDRETSFVFQIPKSTKKIVSVRGRKMTEQK